MKNKLFTLAAALTLAAVIGSIYAAPALASAIKAALVKNVDEPGRAPYSVTLSCGTSAKTCADTATTSDAVPTGKRLVVEYVNSLVYTTGPGGIQEVSIGTTNQIKSTLHLFSAGQDGINYYYTSNGPVRAFFEPGDRPHMDIAIVSGGIQARIIVTGYLVDLNM